MRKVKDIEKTYQDDFNKDTPIEVKEPKKKKFGWLGMILLLVVIGVCIYLMFKITELLPGGGVKDLGTVLKSMNIKYLIISIILAILIPVFVMVEYSIVSHAVTKSVRTRVITKTTILGKYYDYITPFSTGGQPMQIHYLHKHDYDGAHASAIIFIRYAVNIVCWLLVGLALMIVGLGALSRIDNGGSRIFLLIAGIVGITINLLLPLLVLIFVIAPKFANKLTRFIVAVGMKLHIVKNPYKALKKAYKTVHDFRMCFRTIAKKPVHFIFLIILSIIEYLITFSLPFFVMKSLTPIEWNQLFDVAGLNAFSTFAVSFIPTPGNAGGMEISSTLAFNTIAPGVSAYAVLIWRFFTYYIFILAGIFITIFDVIKKAVIAGKSRRIAKKTEQNNE